MQPLHQRRAVREHGALVDRALVRDLAYIQGRWLVHDVKPGHA
jgi:hypothetical protein